MKFDLSGDAEAGEDVEDGVGAAEDAFEAGEDIGDVEADEDVETEPGEGSAGIGAAVAVVVIGVFVAAWEKVLGENDNESDPLGV